MSNGYGANRYKQTSVQTATPGHYPTSKPFSLADLQNETVNYYLSRMSLDALLFAAPEAADRTSWPIAACFAR